MKWATYISPYYSYLNYKKKIFAPDVHEQIMRINWLNRLWAFGIWLIYSPITIPTLIFVVLAIISEILTNLFFWLTEKCVYLAGLLGAKNLHAHRLAWLQIKHSWLKRLEHNQENEEPTGI